ncbi:MAG: YceI family protein [Burkholderiales bacterium]|nr:YceI family protein [Burkholderiales bacterium]
MTITRRTASRLLWAFALAGCAAAPPPPATPPAAAAQARPLAATYAELARAGGRVMRLSPAESSLRILVFRAGRAARLGHNHVLTAPRFTGYFHLPDDGPARATFDLEFRLDELQIDDPAQRAALGSAWASVISQPMIDGTRDHMLSASNMDAQHYPYVRVHALEISGEAPHFAARVAFEMHGQVREFWLPLKVSGLPERVEVEGSVVLRQTDFGVRPYSVGAGLLAVKDEVIVEFRLVGH